MSLKEREEQLVQVESWIKELEASHVDDNYVPRILYEFLKMVRKSMCEDVATLRGG